MLTTVSVDALVIQVLTRGHRSKNECLYLINKRYQ